mgnify:CR=1 FL=1
MDVADGLPAAILDDVEHLTVDRRGAGDDAFMVTYRIDGHVSPGVQYSVAPGKLVPSAEPIAAGAGTRPTAEVETPPQIRLSGTWNTDVAVETEQANILGDVGILTLDTASVTIPEAPATAGMMAYYGACLLNMGDAVQLETDADLPVTLMEIGAGYVDEYLHVAEKGGGSYLEWHDRPHLHMPLDSDARGYLILGRRDGEDYLVSAFRIPFGSAVYMPPEVLHADPYLVGNYLVIYSVTKDFSNAVLRSPDGGVVDVKVAAAA